MANISDDEDMEDSHRENSKEEEKQTVNLDHSAASESNAPTLIVTGDNSREKQEQRQEQERTADLLQNPRLQSSATITVARTKFSKKVNFEKGAEKDNFAEFLPKRQIYTWAKRENGDPEDLDFPVQEEESKADAPNVAAGNI